jgi:aminoglycoside phosphotransferase (APT) family kinase protein
VISDSPTEPLHAVAARFALAGDLVSISPYGSGHINDTYAAVFNQAGTQVRYVLQRINRHVFKNSAAVMENIGRVTAHVRKRLAAAGVADISRRVLTLVPTRDHQLSWVDTDGSHWRCYLFIEGARTYDQIESAAQATAAARAFGEFQGLLADLPAPRLHDTVPAFHHTRQRFAALRQAIENDSANRAAGVPREIAFALDRERIVDVLLDAQSRGELPERVTHNDTKLNNVMLDDRTNEGICVIDLDTVMPGLALYDFGDMCRSACRPTAEDERDLTKVEARMDMFAALVHGYLASAGAFLCPAERRHLAFSAQLITFEVGIRFLTDYLEGDRYFKIRSPDHNAARTRVQFKLLESFEHRADEMERLVEAPLHHA